MKSSHLRIAYGDESSHRSVVLCETMRALGHEVVAHTAAREFLADSEPDLYVIGRRLPDGSQGFDLLSRLRGAGRSAPVLILDESPSFDDMRRAVELGASDIVLHALEAGAMAKAIERASSSRQPKPRIDVEERSHACDRSYTIDDTTVGRAARELAGFLVNEGVLNAHRVRIASALAEVVDNACRHAYPDSSGQVRVHAEVQQTRVLLVVEDQGRGFDPALVKLERVPAALPGRPTGARKANASNGLGRVERLCEDHSISSGSGGTRVELTFELTPVRFDEETESLAETDFLDPARARSLIATLRKGRPDLSDVPPGMAITIGRLIGGLDGAIDRGARPRTRQ